MHKTVNFKFEKWKILIALYFLDAFIVPCPTLTASTYEHSCTCESISLDRYEDKELLLQLILSQGS